ncbi:MAG: hypothetical protein IJR26_10360 [Bacteroidales bacterium]|nr:hypothetical protein [Bacteroidales bacterium]
MKKVILALAVVATVACFSSCNKKCNCKASVAGVSVSTEKEIELDEINDTYNTDYKKCSDVNIDGILTCD